MNNQDRAKAEEAIGLVVIAGGFAAILVAAAVITLIS